MKTNPYALIEVTRGSMVESRHTASLALCDSSANTVFAMGDIDQPVFPRSAIKSFQALPMIESGAADTFGFEPAQIALACSSHNGEEMHTKAAASMLHNAGLQCEDLECGCHTPLGPRAAEDLFRSNGPVTALHNNCSGKHAGMLAFARHTGLNTGNYIRREHPVQREVAAILTDLTGINHDQANSAIDGCSIPTYAIPLKNIAMAAARFAAKAGFGAARSSAAERILNACSDHPEMVAGTERACTKIMSITGRRASVKVGAEGVYLAMFPALGIGAALKVHDGNARAAEVLVAELVKSVLKLEGSDLASMQQICAPQLRNHNKYDVGSIRLEQSQVNLIGSIAL